MRLIMSSDFVRNATYTDESGQVLYKTSHPSRFGAMNKGTTTIHKIMPNADPMDMRDQFKVMGEIEWHTFHSSTFRINGKEMQSSDFLPRHGITGSKRTFTGPDGQLYRWDMLSYGVAMSRDDGSKTEVARSHRGSFGFIGKKKEPCLDIDPDVMHMLDLTFLTFVYMEKLRMDTQTPEMVAATSSKAWEWE